MWLVVFGEGVTAPATFQPRVIWDCNTSSLLGKQGAQYMPWQRVLGCVTTTHPIHFFSSASDTLAGCGKLKCVLLKIC